MANWLEKFGAKTTKETRYGILWQNRMATGIWTQRSPLRDGASTRAEEAYFGPRGDSLIDGLNCEISSKLTLIRRPGNSVYNSSSLPGINRFYSFSAVTDNQEKIRVIADVKPSSAPTVTLSITGAQNLKVVIGYTPLHQPIYGYYLIVGFSTPIPAITTGQTYSFSGLTNYTALNGQTLPVLSSIPTVTLTSTEAGFAFGSSQSLFLSDTGHAVVDPAVDRGTTVRDVTGPSNNQILWNKDPNAGVTSFQEVGNTLYFSDGISANKFIEPALIWKANTSYTAGQFIVDPNGNIQLNIGSQTATIADIQISSGTGIIFLASGTSLDIPPGTRVSLAGLTTVPVLNSTTQTSIGETNTQQFQFANGGSQSFTTETGQATTGDGITASTEPAWSTSRGGITIDGGAQWVNRGSQVETWGISSPTVKPTVTQADVPSIYGAWAASTWYAPLFVILDSNGNLQKLTTAGTTGTLAPTWSAIIGATTSEVPNGGTAVWTCLGTGAWLANNSYVAGDILQVTFTYYVTTSVQDGVDDFGNPIFVTVQQPVTADCLFQCVIGGLSGPVSSVSWNNGLGTTTIDNTVTWLNQSGPSISPWPGVSQTLSLSTAILDSSNNIEKATVLAETGSTAPAWAAAVGSYTGDGGELWLNSGPSGQANTGAWIYGYSYKNSVTGHIGTSSQKSNPIVVSAGKQAVIQGAGSVDPQVDEIVLWRTVQGGSILFYLDEIPNPAGGVWTYTDTTPDTGLNELIMAPVDGINDPPPVGLTALTYHLGRIWGAINNLVYFSTGPDVTAGNGNEAWSASNVFAFPGTVTRLFPTANGLIVFTVSDIFIIQGLGTTTSSFYSAPFLQDIGLVSYDAFSVNGSIVYLYTSDNQVICLDPNSGVSEIGFPIGDQFGPNNGTTTFTPSSAMVTWHVAQSEDKAIYVTDRLGTCWRLSPTPSPETGWTWSPKAQIVGGFSAVQSIEVLPGTHNLLLGPGTTGPILKRDYSVYSDNGSAYNSYAILGSLVLAEPGQIALVRCLTTDSVAIGTPLTLAVQLDEIAPVSAGLFESLIDYVPDPTQLEPSVSLYAQRFYLSQTQQPAACRHLQIQIRFGTDTVKNELLSITLFGGYEQEG
jgi:hypothetical protein